MDEATLIRQRIARLRYFYLPQACQNNTKNAFVDLFGFNVFSRRLALR